MVESMCYAMDKIDQSQQPVSHQELMLYGGYTDI